MLPIKDRTEAGRCLGEALGSYRDRDDVLVLGLPRGGVPVACEVAESLGAQVDLMVVRKLGTPGQSELAMGAIASGVATGATMRAAISALRRQKPARIVVAIPLAPPDTVEVLRSDAAL